MGVDDKGMSQLLVLCEWMKSSKENGESTYREEEERERKRERERDLGRLAVEEKQANKGKAMEYLGAI